MRARRCRPRRTSPERAAGAARRRSAASSADRARRRTSARCAGRAPRSWTGGRPGPRRGRVHRPREGRPLPGTGVALRPVVRVDRPWTASRVSSVKRSSPRTTQQVTARGALLKSGLLRRRWRRGRLYGLLCLAGRNGGHRRRLQLRAADLTASASGRRRWRRGLPELSSRRLVALTRPAASAQYGVDGRLSRCRRRRRDRPVGSFRHRGRAPGSRGFRLVGTCYPSRNPSDRFGLGGKRSGGGRLRGEGWRRCGRSRVGPRALDERHTRQASETEHPDA